MARKKIERGPIWPAWFYGPNEQSSIFDKAEDVPEGWTRKRGEVKVDYELHKPAVILDRVELVAKLNEHGVEIHPLWGNAHMKKVLDDISSAR